MDYNNQIKQAINAGKNRDYSKAIQILKIVISKTDNYPQAFLYLGRSFHSLGDIGQAITYYDYYIKLKPHSYSGYFFIGRSYLALGLHLKAIYYFKKSIKENSHFVPVYGLIAITFLKLKKPELSVKYFELGLNLDPENKKLFNAYLNALLVKAIKFFNKDRFDESSKIFLFLLEHRKKSILPHLYLGRIYRANKAYKESLFHYDEAIKLSPGDSTIQMQKAFLLLKMGQKSKAADEIKNFSSNVKMNNILEQNPDELIKYISITHFKNKQYRKAIHFAKIILKENYKNTEMHAIMAESYEKIDDLEKSKNHFLRCIENAKEIVQYYYGLCIVLWRMEDYPTLQHIIKKMEKINPDDKFAQYFYVLAESKVNKSYEENIKILQNQIHIMGPDFLLMHELGENYLKCGLPEFAEKWFLRTLKIDDQCFQALKNLILVYDSLGKINKVSEYFELYFKILPKDFLMKKQYLNFLLKENRYKKAINEILIMLPNEKNKMSYKKILAKCYIKINKYNEATFLFKELLKHDPNSIDTLKSLVFCFDKLKIRKQAITLLRNALKYFNNEYTLLLNLGVLYFREKEYENAIKYFKSVIEEKPNNWKAYKNLSIVYKKMGNKLFADKFSKRAEQYKQKYTSS